jgi:hypothetical protein
MKQIGKLVVCVVICLFVIVACGDPTSDDIQRQQQEKILMEGTAGIGMPAIKNFREKKLLKEILELRDQDGLVTYTYLYSEMTGKLIFLGESIGYGIPCATQYTNPQKFEYSSRGGGMHGTLPQADPNGLFSPSSAEGTWVLLKDPNSKDVKPVYIEPRIVVSPFKLEKLEIEQSK